MFLPIGLRELGVTKFFKTGHRSFYLAANVSICPVINLFPLVQLKQNNHTRKTTIETKSKTEKKENTQGKINPKKENLEKKRKTNNPMKENGEKKTKQTSHE